MDEPVANFVDDVVFFNTIAGDGEPSKLQPRKISLYLGLMLEELRETIEAAPIRPTNYIELLEALECAEVDYKAGITVEHGEYNHDTLTEILDGCIDTAVVSLGCAFSLGCDVSGAANEVMRSNLSKATETTKDGVPYLFMWKDANGKVIKAEGYSPPDLGKYIHQSPTE
jgi:predicted HAD superfamily Cof-like phosphohydrolase